MTELTAAGPPAAWEATGGPAEVIGLAYGPATAQANPDAGAPTPVSGS